MLDFNVEEVEKKQQRQAKEKERGSLTLQTVNLHVITWMPSCRLRSAQQVEACFPSPFPALQKLHLSMPSQTSPQTNHHSTASPKMAIQQRTSGIFSRVQSLVDNYIVTPSAREKYYNSISTFAQEQPLLFVRCQSQSQLEFRFSCAIKIIS